MMKGWNETMTQKKGILTVLPPEFTPEEIETARKNRNAYMRQYLKQYRQKNPEKQKAYAIRHWARKGDNQQCSSGGETGQD